MTYRHILLVITALFLFKGHTQSTASKRVTIFPIAAPELDTVKQIWVYLPKDYQDSKNKYPVIYMHDAQNLFDDSTAYAGEWKVDEYLDSISNSTSIIVGIEHGNEKRVNELTPYKHNEYGGGQGESYITFIKNTLKPYIDNRYRTKSNPANTTIFGSSLGGLISFYAVIRYPETFGKAGVFSPSFWFSEKIYELVKTTEIAESLKFYFLAGTNESDTMLPNLERMVQLLISKGVPSNQIEHHIIEGGQHNEQLWSTNFGNAYQWLTKND